MSSIFLGRYGQRVDLVAADPEPEHVGFILTEEKEVGLGSFQSWLGFLDSWVTESD